MQTFKPSCERTREDHMIARRFSVQTDGRYLAADRRDARIMKAHTIADVYQGAMPCERVKAPE